MGSKRRMQPISTAGNLEAFRELAEVILGYTDVEIEQRVNDGALFNVEEPGEDNAK